MRTPRANLSWIQWSFATDTLLSLHPPQKTGSSMDCRWSRGPSPERHQQRVSPKLMPLLTFGTSLSHGISWHPQPFVHPIARLQDFQGCTARTLQGWQLRSRLLQRPRSHPALLGYLHHNQTLACACLGLPLRPVMQHHGNLTLVTRLLHLIQGC